MNIHFRECTADDLLVLQQISCQTFRDTFAHLNTASNMGAYLEKAFDLQKLSGELSDSDSRFYFLCADGDLAGYLKLNEEKAQTDIHDPQSLEVERIYVKQEFQGKGLGRFLLEKAVEYAKSRGKRYVWLGVWEYNHKAAAFYVKNGFRAAGKHSFFMGDDEQTDLIMRMDL